MEFGILQGKSVMKSMAEKVKEAGLRLVLGINFEIPSAPSVWERFS